MARDTWDRWYQKHHGVADTAPNYYQAIYFELWKHTQAAIETTLPAK